jgi:hypothetical protein
MAEKWNTIVLTTKQKLELIAKFEKKESTTKLVKD